MGCLPGLAGHQFMTRMLARLTTIATGLPETSSPVSADAVAADKACCCLFRRHAALEHAVMAAQLHLCDASLTILLRSGGQGMLTFPCLGPHVQHRNRPWAHWQVEGVGG